MKKTNNLFFVLLMICTLFLSGCSFLFSNNNYIQKLINIGYGYTNFPRLRKRILYMSSNRKGRLDKL